MSEASRMIALQEATKIAAATGAFDSVLELAQSFAAFIDGGAQSAQPQAGKPAAAASAKPAAAAAKPAAAKPAATKAAKPPQKSEEEVVKEAIEKADAQQAAADKAEIEAETDALKQVRYIVTTLIAKNKRAECVQLLKTFKASSASGVKEEDYAAFIEAGNALLGEDDLTA